jgi:hypothetical protein
MLYNLGSHGCYDSVQLPLCVCGEVEGFTPFLLCFRFSSIHFAS